VNKRRFAPIARFGYAARGTVYVIAGVLALLVTFGQTGGQATGSKGALAALADNSWGSAALVVIAVGLVAFAGWRAVQVVFDADDHGTGPRGLVIRAGLAVSGMTHLLLGFYAATLLTGLGANSGGGSGSRDAAAWMLQQPHGRYLLAAVALAIAGGAIAQLWKGITGGFRERLALPSGRLDRLAPLCGFGLAVRGLVFLVIGDRRALPLRSLHHRPQPRRRPGKRAAMVARANLRQRLLCAGRRGHPGFRALRLCRGSLEESEMIAPGVVRSLTTQPVWRPGAEPTRRSAPA